MATLQGPIQQRRDTAANWTLNNTTLLQGEFGLETDTDLVKLGDGSTPWVDLPYFVTVGPEGPPGPGVKSASFFPVTLNTAGVTAIATVSGFTPSTTFRVRGKVFIETTATGSDNLNFLPTVGNIAPNLLFIDNLAIKDYIADPSVFTVLVFPGPAAPLEFDFVYTNSAPVTSWSLALSYNSAYVDGAVTVRGFIDVMIPVVGGANGAPGVGVPVGGAAGEVLAKIDATDYNTAWVPAASGGATNLSTTRDATSVTVLSDTGTDATLAASTSLLAGVQTAADKAKLDAIEAGATANDTNANLRDRATHTGTQGIATLSDLDKGLANGVASLDSGGKVPLAQIPDAVLGQVEFQGTWNAATNTPTLVDPPTAGTNGHYYIVSVAGTQFSISFGIGDWLINNNGAWGKVDNTDAVTSVFSRIGPIVAVAGDYNAGLITNTPAGSIAATDVQAAINELDGDVTAHVTDATAAHAASAIGFTPVTGIDATDVQAAIVELNDEKASRATGDDILFGTGADGDLTINNLTTTVAGLMTNSALLRDAYFANLTIASPGQLNLNGYRLYVSGILNLDTAPLRAITNGASFTVPANVGGNASGTGAGGQPAAQTGLTAGQGDRGSVGIAGTTGAGTQGTVNAATAGITGVISGSSGAGGTGGVGPLAGGASRAATAIVRAQLHKVMDSLTRGIILFIGGQGGTSGGTGAGDGAAGGGSGAGGNGGAIVFVSARTISRGASTAAGAIFAAGGNGGNGGTPAGGNRGGGGGGAGGGGGVIYMIYRFLTGATGTNVLDVSGGSGGTGGNGLGTGLGGNGGGAGAGGIVYEFNIQASTNTVDVGGGIVAGNAASGTTGGSGATNTQRFNL